MPLLFQSLLVEAGIDPKQVSLLRHRPVGVVDPFSAWRANRAIFEEYQSYQSQRRRGYFRNPIWATFAAVPGGKTIFLSLYRVDFIGSFEAGLVDVLTGNPLDPAVDDRYACTGMTELRDYSERLFIDWGASPRAWIQRGSTEKTITELYDAYREPEFPGYLEVIRPLSEIAGLPATWAEFLRRGVRGGEIVGHWSGGDLRPRAE